MNEWTKYQIVEARSDILDEAANWMAANAWMSGASSEASPSPTGAPCVPAGLRLWCLVIMLALALVSSHKPARAQELSPAAPIAGFWRFAETGEVLEFYTCSVHACARLAALAPGERQTLDARNSNEALRGRPLCGLEVIRNLTRRTEREWRGGDAYSPEDGDSYNVSLALLDDGRLAMRVALRQFPLFGTTYVLKRTAAPSACTS